MSLSKENTESVFKNSIGENREFFKVNVDELKLMSVNKKREKWYVKFQQHYKGIPVYHSTIGLSATEPFKDEYVSILYGGQDTTNDDGFYTLPVPLVYLLSNLPFNITFHLEGPFAMIQDFDGSDFSVTRNFSNNPCKCMGWD